MSRERQLEVRFSRERPGSTANRFFVGVQRCSWDADLFAASVTILPPTGKKLQAAVGIEVRIVGRATNGKDVCRRAETGFTGGTVFFLPDGEYVARITLAD